jgi:hypothetical protein
MHQMRNNKFKLSFYLDPPCLSRRLWHHKLSMAGFPIPLPRGTYFWCGRGLGGGGKLQRATLWQIHPPLNPLPSREWKQKPIIDNERLLTIDNM